MARPLLADADWVNKAAEGRSEEIITCIACNQACLDHTFKNKRATCMLNPRSAHETELILLPTKTVKRVGVVGTGSSGVQSIPVIARQAEHLWVFQRTAQYTIPARHHTVDKAFLDEVKKDYDAIMDKAKWSYGGTGK